MTDSSISLFKKVGIVVGLVYIISPLDAIPDVIPFVGWLDDIGVLAIMYTFMMKELGDYMTQISAEN